MRLNELTISKAHEGLENKDFSCVELVESCLDQIEKADADVHAFISVLKDSALTSAREIDKNGDFRHPLAGIPLAIKDNINIRGVTTTAASKMLEHFVAPFDATVISKLRKAKVIFLGKTNMDEFACGSSTETSFFGVTKNPYDYERVPGGTSGGSAASVAAHESIASLGSDTGGSIRQPASFCGVVGLKPTYGRVSRYGLLSMGSSLDQIGPITKTVKDAALLFQVIAGQDARDSTTVPRTDLANILEDMGKDIKGIRIGVPKEFIDITSPAKGLERGVWQSTIQAIKKLETLGACIDDTIQLPHAKYALPTYYIIMPSELSANLERYDGIRYGFSNREGNSLLDIYQDTRGQGFGAEIRRRIMLGTYALSAGYYEAYYKKALKVRTLIIEDFKKAFKKVDVVISPTSPTVAFKIGEKINDPLSMYLSDIYTVSANVAGIPAISISCGTAPPPDGGEELPVGLQIMGKHFDEQTVLKTAYQFEKS